MEENAFRRALITLLVLGLLIAVYVTVYFIFQAALAVFAGVLLGFIFYSLASGLSGLVRFPYRVSLVIVVGLAAGGLVILSYAVLPTVVAQIQALIQGVPDIWQQILDSSKSVPWVYRMLREVEQASQQGIAQNILGRTVTLIGGVVAAVGSTIFMLALGFFLAASPKAYRDGLIHVLPAVMQRKAGYALDDLAVNLRWWLISRLVSMVVVGLLTGIGLWLLGIPLALALGVIAGLLDFIPNLGPLLGYIPAVLIALGIGPGAAVAVTVLYIGVQMTENYLIQPFVERHTLHLRPAFVLTMQVVFGLLFGFVGVLLATPLTLVTLVALNHWYKPIVHTKKATR